MNYLPLSPADIIERLSCHVTPERLERMKAIVTQRTRRCTLVLEDIYQNHNASALVRSAEGFGIQDIHLIEKRNSFAAHESISRGAEQWLTRYTYESVEECYKELKNQGYTIAATTPAPTAVSLSELSAEGKIAIVLGTEQQGLTRAAIEMADVQVVIPMWGFTQSFNVSVSAGICLYELTSRIRQKGNWQLSANEQQEVMAEWLLNTVPGARNYLEKTLA